VQTALTALQQSRAQYQSADKAVQLQALTLDAEQKKLALGASTPYQVILIQRDVATAQQSRVTALQAYASARVTLDQAIGMTLDRNNIQIDEARIGRVSKPADRIPDVNGSLAAPKPNAVLR
jgi:outer membrane protein TolC